MKNEEIVEITGEDPQAAMFVVSFVKFCHLLDDIVDKDREVTDERLAQESVLFIQELMLNPFVLRHAQMLFPVIVTGFNAWLDSNKWQQSRSKILQRDADVVKGFYHEVIYLVGFLCKGGGVIGWEHLRKITPKFREYDHDFDNKGRN